jgi:hypothetical protein
MARTVVDQFADILVAAGVRRIYGIVGDSLNGLTDALRRQGKIEWIHVRHEEVAAFAAGAEAHLTGELAGDAIGPGEPSRSVSRSRQGAGLRRPRAGNGNPGISAGASGMRPTNHVFAI